MADPDQSHTRLAAVRPDDRRGGDRLPVHVPVLMSTDLLQLEGQLELRGAALNASDGGLFVRSDFLEPAGTRVLLQVLTPRQPLTISGRVAWVSEHGPDGPGMGIELDAESRDEWHARDLLSA